MFKQWWSDAVPAFQQPSGGDATSLHHTATRPQQVVLHDVTPLEVQGRK